MVTQHPGLIEFAHTEHTVTGDDTRVGQQAPDFLAQKNDGSLSKAFKEIKRKVRIVASVPSFDSPLWKE